MISERQIQDRLGSVLQRLASLEERASTSGARSIQNLLTDCSRLARDFERAFENLHEAGARTAAQQREVELAARRATMLLELGSLPYVLVHSTGIIVDANSAAAKALNVSQRHLRGKAFDLFLQNDREGFLQRLQQLQEGAEPARWPAVIRPRERYPRAFSVVAFPESRGQIVLVLDGTDKGEAPADGPVDSAVSEATTK